MVRCPSQLASLGFGLLLAASSAAAQTTLLTSVTTPTAAPTAPTSCVVGLQIFVARGSLEPAGLGRMGVVALNISDRIKDSRVTAVDYPATFVDYNLSVGNGTNSLRSLVTDYANKCPNGKIALMGYSQGAQAVGDLICGTSSSGFAATADLDSRYEKNIVAIVLYGDPTRAVNQTWDVGTATNQGSYFPRQNNAACAPYGPQMRSWCDVGDRYCALGNLTDVHGSYFAKYGSDTTQFVIDKFNASQSTTSTTTAGTPSTSSPGGAGPSGTGAAPSASSPPRNGAASPTGACSSHAWLALSLGLGYLLYI